MSIEFNSQTHEDIINKFNKDIIGLEYSINLMMLSSKSFDLQHKLKFYESLTNISIIKAKIMDFINDNNSNEPDYYIISRLLKYYHKENIHDVQSQSTIQMLNRHHIHCINEQQYKQVPNCINDIKSILNHIQEYFTVENMSKLFQPISVDKTNEHQKMYVINTNWLNCIQNYMDAYLSHGMNQQKNDIRYPIVFNSENKWMSNNNRKENKELDSKGTSINEKALYLINKIKQPDINNNYLPDSQNLDTFLNQTYRSNMSNSIVLQQLDNNENKKEEQTLHKQYNESNKIAETNTHLSSNNNNEQTITQSLNTNNQKGTQCYLNNSYNLPIQSDINKMINQKSQMQNNNINNQLHLHDNQNMTTCKAIEQCNQLQNQTNKNNQQQETYLSWKLFILDKHFIHNHQQHLKFKLIQQPQHLSDIDLKHQITTILSSYYKHSHNTGVDLYSIDKHNKSELIGLIDIYINNKPKYYSKCAMTKITNQSDLLQTHINKLYLIANAYDESSQNRFTIMEQSKIYINEQDIQIDQAAMTEWTKLITSNNKYIGLCGLQNLGNTCYMNSALQCLANTIHLTQYFLYKYKLILNETTTITNEYYQFIQYYWLKYSNFFIPQELKNKYSLKFPEFSDNKPHDALEFLVNFINALDEELNSYSINNKRTLSSKPKELDINEKDQTANHNLTEENIIRKLFYGQNHSYIQCHKCNKELNVFENFNVLYLILPTFKKEVFFYLFYTKDNQIICDHIPIILFAKTKIIALLKTIESKYPKLNINYISLLQMPNVSICEYYDKGNQIVFYERKQKHCIYIFIDNNEGRPKQMLCIDINTQLNSKTNQQQKVNETFETIDCLKSVLSVEITDIKDSNFGLYHNYDKTCKLCQTKLNCDIDISYCLLQGDTSLQYLYGIIQDDIILQIIFNDKDKVKVRNKEQQNIKELQIAKVITLKDCFEYFILWDELNNWKCQNCGNNTKINKVTKIDYPPKYLIIQLKRFIIEYDIIKDQKYIDFPIKDFDISEYLTNPDSDCRYDLYGIIYHMSTTTTSGHYNAICYNVAQKKWILYDDKNVRDNINENNIQNQNAYILFYERKN